MSGYISIIKQGNSVINLLPFSFGAGYISSVAPQWAAGRENPCKVTATPDAPCVFFYVATNATAYHFYGVVCRKTCRFIRCAVCHGTSYHRVNGSSGGAPERVAGVVAAGILTPVWAIAICERENSGDSEIRYATEVALWLRPSPLLTRNISTFSTPCAVMIWPLASFLFPLSLNHCWKLARRLDRIMWRRFTAGANRLRVPAPHVRNIPGFFWPFAVLTLATCLNAGRLPPLITSLPADLLRGIISPSLPGAFHAAHLLIILPLSKGTLVF